MSLAEELGQAFSSGDSNSIEKTLDAIAEKLAYRSNLEELMQMAVVSQEERRQISILYALNKVPMINSDTLKNFMFSNLSLSIAVKGLGREQVLEIGKASMQQVPLSMLARVKGKLGFE